MLNLTLELNKVLAKYGKVEERPVLSSSDGKRVDVPFVVRDKSQVLGVWCWDWKRSIGSDKIIRVEKTINKLGLDGAILLSNRFSQNAYDLVNKIKKENSLKIILIKLEDIMSQ